MSTVTELQEWFARQCDGEWEKGGGIVIESLENPGWSVTVDIVGTPLARRNFKTFRDNYDHDTDWLICRMKEDCFEAACGPLRLEDVLEKLLEWCRLADETAG
ncbi:MAG: immunity 53 family protein [Acidobacteriota bacterium]